MADTSGTDGGSVRTILYSQSFVQGLDVDENGF
jgi:hypothetical protein